DLREETKRPLGTSSHTCPDGPVPGPSGRSHSCWKFAQGSLWLPPNPFSQLSGFPLYLIPFPTISHWSCLCWCFRSCVCGFLPSELVSGLTRPLLTGARTRALLLLSRAANSGQARISPTHLFLLSQCGLPDEVRSFSACLRCLQRW